jgi:hypothetical protein
MSSWKDKLLSSSVPLEYEVAKILVDKGYVVDFDYTYKRLDEKEEKDFSVDVYADAFYPFNENKPIHFTIEMLVECKFRSPNVKWLFLPDINTINSGRSVSYGPVKVIDEFSDISIKERFHFPYTNIHCLKGTEVNVNKGEVHGDQITHGTYQLLYALPYVLRSMIFQKLQGPLDELQPAVICPILVTTAELYVVNYEFDINSVRSAESFEELSTKVDCLELNISVPPSFNQHCKNIFSLFSELNNAQTNYEYLNGIRMTTTEKVLKGIYFSSPSELLKSLMNGTKDGLFSKMSICHIDYFPKLIDQVTQYVRLLDKSKKKLK